MRLSEIADIGEILEIKLKDGSTRTKLLELYDDDEFVVFQPTYKGMPIWTQEDQEFSFTFYRDGGVYSYVAKFIKRYLKDEIKLCRFEAVSKVKRYQRRQAYRLPIVLNAEIECFETEEDVEECEKQTFKAMTVNLSEKAVLVTCFSPMDVDTPAIVTIHFDDSISFILRAKAFRCTKPEKKSDPYSIVLVFVDCPERDIVNLRRFILRQQVSMNKNKKQKA